jgi:hypothetical protein
MQRAQLSKAWNLFIAVVVVASLGTQLVLVIRGHNVLVDAAGNKPAMATRVVRFFSYFTVLSNLLVAYTVVTLVKNPEQDGRVWRVLRLNALVGIAVTGLIYVTLLRPVVNLSGIPKLTDVGMHYVVPLATVIGWLFFGPRPRIDNAALLPSLIYPAAYIAYTFVHGATTDWYPYPFTDVVTLGYLVTLRNGVGICVLLLGVSTLFMYADSKVSSMRATVTSDHAG